MITRKYEEIKPPHVEDFCYITDNTYTKEEVVKMEAEVLKALKFEMGSPTIKSFLRYNMLYNWIMERHTNPISILSCTYTLLYK